MADSVPGQVVVKLQYSHNLGNVGGDDLQTLLNRLSAYEISPLQWTLSAPIQACASSQSSAATATNLFCMTNPAPHCQGKWPHCVVGEATDTILVDYWFAVTSVDVTNFVTLDEFVKKTISDWVKNTLKFQKKVWIASRFTEELTSPVRVKHDKVDETTTINKVMSHGYD